MSIHKYSSRVVWLAVLGWMLLTMGQIPASAAETMTLEGVINLNTATVSDLTMLPRVGEKVAQRIIEFRENHGVYKRPEDLMNVRGIGVKTFEQLKPHLVVEGETTLRSTGETKTAKS